MEPFVLKTKEYFSLQPWAEEWPNLVVGFTTKNGGFSDQVFSSLNFGLHVGDQNDDVCKNKQKLAELLQFPTKFWVAAEQTHGKNIKEINVKHRGLGAYQYSDSIKDTDGFYTNQKGILLTLCYADCVPIYFIDKRTNTIGLVHAGWKGTVNGISVKMIDRWKQNGIHLDDILVVIGPSICEKCYVVDDFVINFVQKILEDVEKKPYNQIKDGQYQLDLKRLNQLLLIHSGIPESNISLTEFCSSCNASDFFSHRRDQGKTGRMMSFIGWKEDSLINESNNKA
ncbi:peptidoglycan editing factor PgeF [Bacillus sp. CGMCC 1.16607]|uniref:peptidoglycan editing factor PgeF n=1 Tax=Bacillus sp. CGMCC 1.16607 TaxID=3351842 RepID=UPI003641ABA7